MAGVEDGLGGFSDGHSRGDDAGMSRKIKVFIFKFFIFMPTFLKNVGAGRWVAIGSVKHWQKRE
jgi:hypothetical protein